MPVVEDGAVGEGEFGGGETFHARAEGMSERNSFFILSYFYDWHFLFDIPVF